MSDYYILKDKEPVQVDMMTWAKGIDGNRDVAKDKIGKVLVSTVFLGLDHRFGFADKSDSKPILFETMVFGGDLDGEQERYCTWDDAEKGHQFMCEKVKGE